MSVENGNKIHTENLELKLTGDKDDYNVNQDQVKRPCSAGYFNEHKETSLKDADSTSLDSIEDISRDLPSSAILNHLLAEPVNFSNKSKKCKVKKRFRRSNSLSVQSEESISLSEISSIDILDAKIKKLIEDSSKCKKMQKEVEELINSSKEVNEENQNIYINECKMPEMDLQLLNENFITNEEKRHVKLDNVTTSVAEENYLKQEPCKDLSAQNVASGSSNIPCELVLTPGLKYKPPLPKKSQPPKIVIDAEEMNFNNSDKEMSCYSNFCCEQTKSQNTSNFLATPYLQNEIELLNSEDDSTSLPVFSYNGNDHDNEQKPTDDVHILNENPIELKVQNWIKSEPNVQIINDIVINQIQTDISLQNLSTAVKSSVNNNDTSQDVAKCSQVISDTNSSQKSLTSNTPSEKSNKLYRTQDFRKTKRPKNSDKSVVSSLDQMYAGGDGFNNNPENEILESFLKAQGNNLKTRIPANSKLNYKKNKSSPSNTSKQPKVKPKTISRSNEEKPKENGFIKSPDVESWMSLKKNSKSETSKIETQPNKALNFCDFLENINELEMTTIPLAIDGNISDVNLETKSSKEDNDDPYDEILSVLKVLEDVDKKSHENMECMKGIAKNAVILSKENKTRENGNGERENFDIEGKIPSPTNACQRNYSSGNDGVMTGTGTERNKGIFFPESSKHNDNKSSINLNEIMSYLDEVDRNYSKSLSAAKERAESATKMLETTLQLDNIPRIEELELLTSKELAHQVIDMHLRLKEKSSSITILQKELSALREQVTKMTRQADDLVKQKLKSQKEEYETVVKRHQKFIDQLIADKKTLNQQCESLIHETKVLEERFNSNLRTAEHRHKVELQKIKDMQKANEKMRRDKWVDNKTQKIKELTVKSLEPELEKMAARHQRELSDLRALHKNEIEDLELRHSRKMQQQMEALREQLIEAREKAIVHEREVMRQRYENMVETEEKNFQEQRRKLMAEHAKMAAECEEREKTAYMERDKAIRQAQLDFEEKLDAINRRHCNEINVLQEKMEMDIGVFKNNYRKQQEVVLAEKEMAIREKCRRERDKEIETVIERLEQEASESQTQVEQTAENRIRRLREKYENEIKELEASEREAKGKYTETKTKLLEAEDAAVNLKASIKQLEMQLHDAKEFSDKLSSERDKMKEIVRDEMRIQMEKLEKELHNLKNDKDRELQQVYSRVRMAVARKDDILQELSRDHVALQEKCAYLENMLEQQRKEYLIK